MILLTVLFPLSSCSFFSYAHMCTFDLLEKEFIDSTKQEPLFDLELALTVLAISLPLSSMIILTVCLLPDFFLLIRPIY